MFTRGILAKTAVNRINHITTRRSNININYRVNERIRVPNVRLIDQNGKQHGVVSLKEAKKLAAIAKLDLVEVDPKPSPPVVKILDFGKFKYDLQQKEKDAKKQSHKAALKEMRFRVNIEQHDFQTKAKQAAKFLSQGHKVKVTVQFKGREVTHPEQGAKVMEQLIQELKEVGKPETPPRKEGRNISLMLLPEK